MTRRQFTTSFTSGAAAIASGIALPGKLCAETQRERAKRVIDRTIQALGGDAFRNMQTRIETGSAYSFSNEEVSGLSPARIHTKYLRPPAATPEKPPLLQVQRQVYGKKDDEAVLLSATEAWDVTYRGAARLPQSRIDQFRETTLHDCLYILRQRVGEAGSGFDSHGSDIIANQPVETVEFFDIENRSVTIWIHSSTFLPIRQSYKVFDPVLKDRIESVTHYSKYRGVGNGIQWPFNIQRERDGSKVFELFSTTVTTGMPQEDSLFQLPPGIKIWKQ